ncbi:hypothetical protein [Chondromyces crocatus]|uniref:Uncharacterized protein n=1 Tax=Chondromyces crocatus TaxID=52 RepID=A0A0K1ECR2_CHOCO|nr:hypothetical protein [Chondromyces crocatus]AKT38487.1 uncharacterized protein CMC5_026340 [Chondromyces crocatus]
MLVTAIAAACGARSSLLIDEFDDPSSGGGGTGPIADAGPDADADTDAGKDAGIDADVVDCRDTGVTYIYLVADNRSLYSFNPEDRSLILRGTLNCPAGGASPFSMGVDRQGTAYVVYNNGQLFRASIFDASCETTPFLSGQHGFTLFGMGFATDGAGPEESLYVAEISFQAPSRGLATIDTQTFELTPIGPFSQNPGNAIEMTGTGDGHLYGYFINSNGTGGHVVEIDKQTATILSSVPLSAGASSGSLAFAFWGGDFYTFTSIGPNATRVTRYNPADGSTSDFAEIPAVIVGAGVSTCAPPR